MSLPNPDLEFIPYDPLSAGQLNDIVENVESLAGGTGFNDDAVPAQAVNFGGSGTGIWWEEIGRTKLSSAGDTISITGLPSRRYLLVMVNVLQSGAITSVMRFNNDSGTNYSLRYDNNNGGAGTAPSSASFGNFNSGTEDVLAQVTITNILSKEKICYADSTTTGAAGAGNTTGHVELNGKWANTSSVINRIDVINTGVGDFAIDSEVVVLGHD